MKIKAAILWEPKTEWSVEDVDLDPPKEGEVLLKLVGSGLCQAMRDSENVRGMVMYDHA